jgi:hypothetical protein
MSHCWQAGITEGRPLSSFATKSQAQLLSSSALNIFFYQLPLYTECLLSSTAESLPPSFLTCGTLVILHLKPTSAEQPFSTNNISSLLLFLDIVYFEWDSRQA